MSRSLVALASTVLLLSGLPVFAAEPSRPAAPDLATAEVIDLTHFHLHAGAWRHPPGCADPLR